MYSTTRHDAALERQVIERIGTSWNTRVAVRQDRLDLTQYYDPSIPDFPTTMVPFWNEPEFAALDQAVKLRFLAAAWIAYNEKAIYLEDEIVQPLCSLLLKNRLPGVSDPQVKQVLAQVQVDEQFHILMCLDICNNARERHDLFGYEMPEPLLGVRLKQTLAETPDAYEATILRLAYASVAEMSINAYLNQVASDQSIQPLNRINTDMHRRDESAHSMAFRQIVGSCFRALDARGQDLFRRHISDALDIFTTPDHGSWASILAFLDIPGRDALLARLDAATRSKRLSRDYTVLSSLFDEIGLKGVLQ
jgi:alpha-N-dichloroacetyl-p-aminophenylserinol N-oxygenase